VTALGIFAAVVLLYGLFSRRLAGSGLTPPLAVVLAGLLLGLVGLSELSPADVGGGGRGELLLTLAELGLALVLFADASAIGLPGVRRDPALAGRLLGLGLPLTILLGAGAALLVLPELDGWEALALGGLLAPTDAALAAGVVSDRRLPSRIRRGLNIEAGLNDGVSVPVVTFAVAGAVAAEGVGPERGLLTEALVIVGGGLAVGLALGWAGGRLLAASRKRGWMTERFERLAISALATGTFVAADKVGASGFIAAFVAGLVAGPLLGTLRGRLLQFSQEEGQLLTLAVFFGFGIFAGGIVDDLTWQAGVYTLLSLTLVRMAPVALALAASGLRAPTVAFIGWFGPRGIASIALMLVIIADEPDLAALGTLVTAVTLTVVVSTVVHGVSAPALSARYGRFAARLGPGAAELADPDPAEDPPQGVRPLEPPPLKGQTP